MNEQQRKHQEVKRNKTLVAVGIAIIVIALTMVAIAFSGNSIAQGADDCTPKQVDARKIQVSEGPGPGKLFYENADLGVRFIYPEAYTVIEQTELEDTVTGEVMVVEVLNEAGEVVFSLTATSEDFAISSSGECCYYLSGELEISGTVTELEQTIELQIGNIFLPMKASINEKEALAFYYANEDTRTYVESAYAVPFTHDIYSNVFLRSGALYSQNGTFASNENKVTAIFEDDDAIAGRGVPLLDDELEAEFMEIVKSIQWDW